MRIISKIEFGSHLYGTSNAESDRDYKGIFIPSARDIILQKVTKSSLSISTKKNNNSKNTKDDTDTELFPLQCFLRLAEEGQTVAIDYLFAPEDKWVESSEIWRQLINNRNKLLHKGTRAFVSYCINQAAKYGVKGSRIAALKESIEYLKRYSGNSYRIGDLDLDVFVRDKKHIGLVEVMGAKGAKELHLDVCNRKIGMNAKIPYAIEMFQNVLDRYGERAKLAEQNQSVDWKALMHAVRVCREAEELLLTHFVTFPRPEKDLLLQIRKGELPYREVSAIIEEGMARVEDANNKSTLPTEVDRTFWDQFIEHHYLETIRSHYEEK